MSDYSELGKSEEEKINILRSMLPASPFDFLINEPRPVRGEYELITNFDKDKYVIYEEALERYKLLSDKPKDLKLDIASNEYCDYGLWLKKGGLSDLSVFWKIFDEAEKGEADE